jgi:RimJ/RimL family protein N-acetyltransferase
MDTRNDFTIRRLDPDDAAAWATLRKEALETHPLAFGASMPDEFNTLVETAIDRLKVSDESAFFGAFGEDVLVGTVGIWRDDGAKERHKCMLVAMYVRADNRRAGVGSLLVRTAIEHARSWNGVEQIQLVVNDVAPAAKRLYEKNGFRAWGISPRALNWEGQYTDATHMILDLREAFFPIQ